MNSTLGRSAEALVGVNETANRNARKELANREEETGNGLIMAGVREMEVSSISPRWVYLTHRMQKLVSLLSFFE